jgi:hypothetical protein
VFLNCLWLLLKKALGKEALCRVLTLDKELFCPMFSFIEGFFVGTRQRIFLSSVRKEHSVKYLALAKEPNSGSE